MSKARDIAGSRSIMREFLNRDALKNYILGTTYITSPQNNLVTDGDVVYLAKEGATAIPDMPDMLPFGEVNVLHFGAVNDGVADDRDAIQNAMNYVASLGDVSVVGSLNAPDTRITRLAGSHAIGSFISVPTNVTLKGSATTTYPAQSDPYAGTYNVMTGTIIKLLPNFVPHPDDQCAIFTQNDNVFIEGIILDGDALDGSTWWPTITATSITSGKTKTTGLKLPVLSSDDYRRGGNVQVVTESVAAIHMDEPFVFQFEANGGDQSSGYTWSVDSGTLPAGITLSSSGRLSGTPTAVTGAWVKVRVTDSSASYATQDFYVMSLDTYIESSILPGGTANADYPPLQIETRSNYAGRTVYYHLKFAPEGMAIDRYTGVISGTLAAITEGNYEPTVALSSDDLPYLSANIIHSFTLSMEVLENGGWPKITDKAPPRAVVGQPFSKQFRAVGGSGSYTWSINPNRNDVVGYLNDQAGYPQALSPAPGLTLDPVTGILSGTPTTSGNFHFYIRATDNNDPSRYYEDFVVFYGAGAGAAVGLEENGKVLPPAIVGVPYTYALQSSEPCTFDVMELPAGLSVSSAGVISGTPTLPQRVNGISWHWSACGKDITVRNFRMGYGFLFKGPSNLHRIQDFIIRNCDVGMGFQLQTWDSRFNNFYIAHCRTSIAVNGGSAANHFSNFRIEFCFEHNMVIDYSNNTIVEGGWIDTSGWSGIKMTNSAGCVISNNIFHRSGRLVQGGFTPMRSEASSKLSSHLRVENCSTFSITGNTTQKGSDFEGTDTHLGIKHPNFLRPSHAISLLDNKNGTITGNQLAGCARQSVTVSGGDQRGVLFKNNLVAEKSGISPYDPVNTMKLSGNILTNSDFSDWTAGGSETAVSGNRYTYAPLAASGSRGFGDVYQINLDSTSGIAQSFVVERFNIENDKVQLRADQTRSGSRPPSFYYANFKKTAETGVSAYSYQLCEIKMPFILGKPTGDTRKELMNRLVNRTLQFSFWGRSKLRNQVLPSSLFYADSSQNSWAAETKFTSNIALTPEWKKYSIGIVVPDYQLLTFGNSVGIELRLSMDDKSKNYDLDLTALSLTGLAPDFFAAEYVKT
tara:strand:- start:82 stop:3348 length:3267 start_codon:yes stop_codon:yes gene_type:complete